MEELVRLLVRILELLGEMLVGGKECDGRDDEASRCPCIALGEERLLRLVYARQRATARKSPRAA
jgi:hypothetical protein